MSYIVRASAWENELVDRIKKILGNNADVSVYPNNPNDYMMKHRSAEVLVRYTGSTYANTDIHSAIQESIISAEAIFLFRRLRDALGLYDSMQRVLSELIGSQLNHATSPIWFDSDELMGEHHGIWQYMMKMKFKSVMMGTAINDE